MTELKTEHSILNIPKTLKNIELKENGINITDLRTLETLRRYDFELRAEAIKWIKELNNGLMPSKRPTYIWKLKTSDRIKIDNTDHQDLIQWIMTFFNITIEDLKGEQEK